MRADVKQIIDVYCHASGPIAITPMESMDLHGIEDKEDCLTGMQVLASHIKRRQQEAREEERKARK